MSKGQKNNPEVQAKATAKLRQSKKAQGLIKFEIFSLDPETKAKFREFAISNGFSNAKALRSLLESVKSGENFK